MAGLEKLEIHSKSYLVRWLEVSPGNTISWSVQPHKKSINFGVFKHPGNTSGPGASLLSSALSREYLNTPRPDQTTFSPEDERPNIPRRSSAPDASPVIEKLERLGLKTVIWAGKFEADRVNMGKHDVLQGEGGMYGLVLDNTFSKNTSKTVTFVLMTYPTSAPPKTPLHMYYAQTMHRNSSISIGNRSPALQPVNDSNESLSHSESGKLNLAETSHHGSVDMESFSDANLYTGILSKKRRKRNQGYARRFFSLDFTSSTLSYYKNKNSSALRGAIPLSLAAVGTSEKSREISVDSGTDVWLLRAPNRKAFEGWKNALERASQIKTVSADVKDLEDTQPFDTDPRTTEDREWVRVEELVGRVAGITGAVRRLANDTRLSPPPTSNPLRIRERSSGSASGSPIEREHDDYFPPVEGMQERSRFWQRKSSAGNPATRSPSGLLRKTISSQKQDVTPLGLSSPSDHAFQIPKRKYYANEPTANPQVHERCAALLRDLDAVVAEFSSLIAESRQRRTNARPPMISRMSMESSMTQEYFDAEDDLRPPSQLLTIRRDSEFEEEGADNDKSSILGDSVSSSEADFASQLDGSEGQKQLSLFPPLPGSLTPLPHDPVTRRKTVSPSSGTPPSLISFLRKNVGKDLSTISMPVTANEPVSLLQRQAEQMENAYLLDAAVNASAESGERLLYIAAFAIGALASSRMKERAIRKPFNPLLGETFEFVREDQGFRFMAEKISHRPIRVACQAESQNWTFLHSPAPVQKFWGKSAELNTDGRVRIILRVPGQRTDEVYSWLPATCFLRNIIAGEKYIEPVANMIIVDESSGRKAVVAFKSSGMFSGRIEDVTVEAFDSYGGRLPLGLQGKWTQSLTITSSSHGHDTAAGHEIWTAGPLVQPSPAARYGITAYGATLNEVTEMEKGVLPPTDSRLRPDQRAHEDGDVATAEALKAKLEDAQRRRRKELELNGETWQPRWFEMAGTVGDDEIWRLKGADKGESYWDVRQAVIGSKTGRWDGVKDLFEL